MPRKQTSTASNSQPGLRYEVNAVDDNETEIIIYGDIGENFWEPELSNSGRELVEVIEAIATDYITVRISSHGGSVKDALEIVNALRRHAAAITTEIDAVAFSAASMIACGGGDTVRMSDNALMMIHAPSSGVWGNSTQMRSAAEMLDKYSEAMAQVYVGNGVTYDEALALLLDGVDHYYTANEALAAGFVNEITESMPIAALANFDLSRYHNLPAAAAVFARKEHNKQREEIVMPEKKKPAAQKPANQSTTNQPIDDDDNIIDIGEHREQAATEAVGDIQARNDDLITMKRLSSDPAVHKVIDAVIADTSISKEAALKQINDAMGADVTSAHPAGHAPHISITEDAQDKRVAGMSNAILCRVGAKEDGKIIKADDANPWRGMRLHEIARACLQATGLNTQGMDIQDVAEKSLARHAVRGAQTSSDFPIILENTMHKMVLMGFMATVAKYDQFCKLGDVTDFRDWSRIVPGLIGDLDGVNEAGEYLNKNIPDGEKNTIAASRKGNIIRITPETIINDDTGYIMDMATGLGAAGPRAIDRAVFALLLSNPLLSDGFALFSSDHNNLAGAGAAPSVVTLSAAADALAAQTAPGDDAEPLDILPWSSVSGTGVSRDISLINEAVYDPDTANKLQRPNKARGFLVNVVGSARVAGNVWYEFADPSIAPVIEVVFLNGQREPRVVQEENFNTSGLNVKVELPFGVGAIDYRGGYKNPGA